MVPAGDGQHTTMKPQHNNQINKTYLNNVEQKSMFNGQEETNDWDHLKINKNC